MPGPELGTWRQAEWHPLFWRGGLVAEGGEVDLGLWKHFWGVQFFSHTLSWRWWAVWPSLLSGGNRVFVPVLAPSEFLSLWNGLSVPALSAFWGCCEIQYGGGFFTWKSLLWFSCGHVCLGFLLTIFCLVHPPQTTLATRGCTSLALSFTEKIEATGDQGPLLSNPLQNHLLSNLLPPPLCLFSLFSKLSKDSACPHSRSSSPAFPTSSSRLDFPG